jgi:hypothetical protein
MEQGAVRRRNLVASSSRPGSRTEILSVENVTRKGYYAYLDLFPGHRVRSATYSLGITATALPSRPSRRR